MARCYFLRITLIAFPNGSNVNNGDAELRIATDVGDACTAFQEEVYAMELCINELMAK